MIYLRVWMYHCPQRCAGRRRQRSSFVVCVHTVWGTFFVQFVCGGSYCRYRSLVDYIIFSFSLGVLLVLDVEDVDRLLGRLYRLDRWRRGSWKGLVGLLDDDFDDGFLLAIVLLVVVSWTVRLGELASF